MGRALALVCLAFAIATPCAAAQPPRELVVEGYDDVVTTQDLGIDDFSGNSGALNSSEPGFGTTQFVRSGGRGSLRLSWSFAGGGPDAFTGLYWSLFGLTDVKVSDGRVVSTVGFPEHALDLNDVDQPVKEPRGPRRVEAVHLDVVQPGPAAVTVRLELKDTAGGGRFTRIRMDPAAGPRALVWRFRDPTRYEVAGDRDLDVQRAKVLSLVVEHDRAPAFTNPEAGALEVRRVALVPSRVEAEPSDAAALLSLAERRACQYFVDWSSRKGASEGIPQDRSSFPDLLSVGGLGFALPAYAICAERGWISRRLARERTRAALRVLTKRDGLGPERVGRVGYRGWLYHFLGPNGRRKQNFDFPDTAHDESLDTIELSTIDTGLALMGVLAAQSYFDGSGAREREIRRRAQTIYERVDWPFMLHRSSRQFYLGWKPREQRAAKPAFAIPAKDGSYSGTPADPATLDYYTDEAFIVTLLAAGAMKHRVSPGVHCAWIRQRGPGGKGFVRTYPGALFTYQFLHAFVDVRTLAIPPCPAEGDIDWYKNSIRATEAAIAYAAHVPRRFSTYGPNAWGISAAEGPFDAYHAYGARPLAIDAKAQQDGTVTYYGMLSAAGYGATLRGRAAATARAGWRRGDWHPRFGLPDAFNDQIAEARLDPAPRSMALRTDGRWVQRALFAIDEGPMLLHLENARSGLVWRLLARNPNLRRALRRLRAALRPPRAKVIEAESGNRAGPRQPRSNASGRTTVLLHSGQRLTIPFESRASANYALRVRYSNDNSGPRETVKVVVDGQRVGSFLARDTGDLGRGWNRFAESSRLGPLDLRGGRHTLALAVSGGDGYGVEFDAVRLGPWRTSR